jgi:DNA ligase-4
MPFLFSLLCDLLNKLDRNRETKALKRSKSCVSNSNIIMDWFGQNNATIPREGPGAVAFLSCLFPERRADRVFDLQEKRLESIIQKAQGLGETRLKSKSGELEVMTTLQPASSVSSRKPT